MPLSASDGERPTLPSPIGGENGRYILFVHPCEFLVTGPDGAILTTALLGSSLEIVPAEIGLEKDPKQVFYFDLPLKPR